MEHMLKVMIVLFFWTVPSQTSDTLKDEENKVAKLNANSSLNAPHDSETALKDAENKLANCDASLNTLRAEMEQRLREKDMEIEDVRRSAQQAIEELQRTHVEDGIRCNAEISRMRQKYETDFRELQAASDAAHRANTRFPEQIKNLHSRNRELEAALEEARRRLDDTRSELSLSETKTIALATELDDVRAFLESVERSRNSVENELVDTSVRLSRITTLITALSNEKSRVVADIAIMKRDMDDAVNIRNTAKERTDRLKAKDTDRRRSSAKNNATTRMLQPRKQKPLTEHST